MSRLDPCYPIVDSAAWVQRLLPVGVKLIQLRIKDRPGHAIRHAIGEALAACRAHGAQLVVNDHWREALDAGADFIHLGQGDLDTADLAEIRRRGARLGISTHDEAELERALGCAPAYVALGPIYPTTAKLMPWAPQGLARIAAWKQRIGRLPLVAIGGLTPPRAAGCLAAGADVVAVMGDVSGHADPAQRARAWLRLTRDRA
jgi:thiamine-phosphate pyrophosphorylase